MPIYLYFCHKCQKEFECIHGMNDMPIGQCDICNEQSTDRRPTMPCAIINSTPKTLGSLADRKRKELGKYAYEDTLQKMANSRGAEYCGKLPEKSEFVPKPKVDRPWYRPDRDTADLSLTKMTPQQTEKYIMEGKKPIPTS